MIKNRKLKLKEDEKDEKTVDIPVDNSESEKEAVPQEEQQELIFGLFIGKFNTKEGVQYAMNIQKGTQQEITFSDIMSTLEQQKWETLFAVLRARNEETDKPSEK